MSKVTVLPTDIDSEIANVDPWVAGGGNNLPVSPADGWPVSIASAELKENTNGNGAFIEFTHQIIEGEHAGKTGIDRVNVYLSEYPEAEMIGRRFLASYKLVTGVQQAKNLQNFVGKQLRVIVKHQTPKDPVKAKEAIEKGYTEIKGVKDINGGNPSRTMVSGAGVSPSPMTSNPPVNTAAPTTATPSAFGTAAPTAAAPTQAAEPAHETGAVPAKPSWAK